MNNREKLWQHFVESGNPMSYVAYRQQAKKDDVQPRGFSSRATRISHENL
jgi:hypothetical protein